MAKVLKVSHLSKKFKAKEIVKNITLEIRRKEIVGLLGPNGAGKTTSFYMIVGLISPDQGKITIDDKDITRFPLHLRAQAGISYLPQEASIFRKLTVKENILAIIELQPDLTRAQRLATLAQLLDEFRLTPIENTLGSNLSGGERRRVEIARALATNPQFILLDEPFAGVDPISIVDINRIIAYLQERGLGVLITDHNVRETLRICGRAYIVNQGEIICEGDPQTILNNPHVRAVYLGDEFNL